MGEENQDQFISWLSAMLEATDEEDLKRKVQELGEEGIKNAYNQFMQESTEIRSNKDGGKLEYIKCLQELAKGGKVNCGCGGVKLSLKKDKGGKLSRSYDAGSVSGLTPKKVKMGQGVDGVLGGRPALKRQQGGVILKGANGTGYTQQDVANLKANGFKGTLQQWAAMNDQWNLADASTLDKPKMYGYGPMDRPGNTARQMNQAEWEFARQNMGKDPRYTTASTNGLLNDVYATSGKANMMESGDSWKDVDHWVQQYRNQQPNPAKPINGTIQGFYSGITKADGSAPPVRAGAGQAGIGYGRVNNGAQPTMTPEEYEWLTQNSEYLKRPDIKTGTPIAGKPYNSMAQQFLTDYEGYHTGLLNQLRQSKLGNQVAARQQGGKLVVKQQNNQNGGNQMMQAPTPEQVQEQKVDAKVQEMTMRKSNIKLTPIDQLMQSLQPKQIKPKPEKTIRLVSRNDVIAGKE